MAYYTALGKTYKGKTHKMSDGTVHSGAKHTASSKKLYKRKPKRM
jgi:hypothetical protein